MQLKPNDPHEITTIKLDANSFANLYLSVYGVVKRVHSLPVLLFQKLRRDNRSGSQPR